MKAFIFVATLLAATPAFSQNLIVPSQESDAIYGARAAQQTASELFNAVIGLRAQIAKLQDENTKLKAELAKAQAPIVDPPK